MSSSDARDIIDSIQSLSGPVEIDPSKHYAVPLAGEATLHVIEPAAERHLAAPRRVRGSTVAYDVPALQALWEKYSIGGSELFGDPLSHRFVAVLNGDTDADLPGFRDHRVEMPLRTTPAWEAWTGMNGRMVSQVEFAEFIEARLVDVVRPTGADMLELASTLEASSSVEFKSAVALSSGVRTLQYEETQTARAGQTGQLEIPKEIELGVAPYEGGDTFRVTARFRHRIRNGSLTLGFVLDRPEDVVKAAFEDFSEKVSAACDTSVLLGTPPQPTLSY